MTGEQPFTRAHAEAIMDQLNAMSRTIIPTCPDFSYPQITARMRGTASFG
jgi:hypothetical protein